jgi:hypothetical protein
VVTKAIEGLEARIVELQQMIKRLDSLMQSLSGLTFLLPQCSGLITISNGTGGVLADLVSSQNKPADSPLAYGGGFLLLLPIPPGTTYLLDFLMQVFGIATGNPTLNGSLGPIPTATGIGDLPAAPPSSPEPDVL